MDKKRILVIDDDVTATRLLKIGLERTGTYEVQEENSAVRGLAAAKQFKPDLIVLDIVMPHLDGGDVASRITADSLLRGTPIMFLTSLVSGEEAADGSLRSGGHPLLAKPVSIPEVVACIERELGRPSTAPAGANL